MLVLVKEGERAFAFIAPLVCEQESVFNSVSMMNVEVDVKASSEFRCEGVDREHNIVHVAKPIWN